MAANLRKIEIAKILIVLNKTNIPVQIYNIETIKNAFKGTVYIEVVPDYVMLIEFGMYFKKYKPTEFRYIEDNKMLKNIKRERIENIELK